MSPIRIDIISDIVCPWCYIGKRRLEKAIQKLDDPSIVRIFYHPFELNPYVPAAGFDSKAYLVEKFGSEAHYEKLTDSTAAVAREEGLEFHFYRQQVMPNTRTMHRIILFAQMAGDAGPLVEAFHKAYFIDGTDLTNIDNLIAIAVAQGLDGKAVSEMVTSGQLITEVEQAEKTIMKSGIRAVPFFIFNNKFGVSGGQPVDVFSSALAQTLAEV